MNFSWKNCRISPIVRISVFKNCVNSPRRSILPVFQDVVARGFNFSTKAESSRSSALIREMFWLHATLDGFASMIFSTKNSRNSFTVHVRVGVYKNCISSSRRSILPVFRNVAGRRFNFSTKVELLLVAAIRKEMLRSLRKRVKCILDIELLR
jgi:hypothetical protein